MTDRNPARLSSIPRLIAVASILSMHFFTLLVLMFVLCSIVPKYTMFFDFVETKLPAVTIHVIRWSFVLVKYWCLLIVFGMFADAAVVGLLAILFPKRNWVLSAYSHIWLLAVILIMLWISIALCVPIYSMAGS